MRKVLCVVVCLLALNASVTTCVTISWTARDFLAAKSDAARAVAQGPQFLEMK